jgi:hypothetical protein
MATSPVIAGAAGARREEETMTGYTRTDLDEGWEFKFLRASTRKFRDPVRLQAILREEARAGWTLVEKFDDTRLRLKRPASARAGDAALPFDPYRTWVGISPSLNLALAIAVVFAAIGVAVVLGVFFTMSRGAH